MLSAGYATEVVAVTVGEAKAAETLRTALAMGADRAIHVKTDDETEPLAVAKASPCFCFVFLFVS